MLLVKKRHFFFFDVDLVKISLDIMLSDFPKENRNLLDYKKHIIFQSRKNRIFVFQRV